MAISQRFTERPTISQASVAQALNELGFAAKPIPNPLYYLFIVDLMLTDPSLPLGDQSRAYALHTLLVNLIERELATARARIGVPMPDAAWRLDQFAWAIGQEAVAHQPAITAWSLLYHRYVRPELAITPEQYSEWMVAHTRTYRRYHATAVKRLTHALIDAEYRARREHHQRRLLARLPSTAGTPLYGRDEHLLTALDQLQSRTVRHMLITGAAGMGKTVFAQALIRTFIDADQVVDVIWIDQPRSVAYIRDTVAANLLDEDSHFTVREVMLRSPSMIIVCDECSQLDDLNALEALLREYDSALVVLTSSVYLALAADIVQLNLTPLDETAVQAMVVHHLGVHEMDSYGGDMAAALSDEIGGNPGAIRAALAQLEVKPWNVIKSSVDQTLFKPAFEAQTPVAQSLWCAAAIYPQHTLHLSALHRLWDSVIDSTPLTQLRMALVMESGATQDTYQLIDGAARFIRGQFATDPTIRGIIEALVIQLDQRIVENPDAALDLVQHLLLEDWIGLGEVRRIAWMRALWRIGVHRGGAGVWRLLLEPMHEGDLQLGYAVCLCRLGEWQSADEQFERVIGMFGMAGDFLSQAHALLERSILARSQGEYERAEVMLQRVENAGRKIRHTPEGVTLLNTLIVERAQVAADRRQYPLVLRLLETVPPSARMRLLQSEAALEQNDADAAREFARQAAVGLAETDALLGTVYNLVGRSHMLDSVFDLAERAFLLSITVLEQSNDRRGLARARSNLGVAYLHQGNNDSAKHQFTRAEQDFARLADTVGLATVRHNWILLRQRMAGT